MSYAIRNTIILLVVLTLISGGGYAYFEFVQKPQIESLSQNISELDTELSALSETASQLPSTQEQYEESREFIDNFEKTLFDNNNPDETYRFLSIINSTEPLEFDFVFNDSTSTDQYGILQSQVDGQGSYRSVLNFISRIENSEPVQKVSEIVITPVNEVGSYSDVNFNFRLQSFYDRQNVLSTRQTPGVSGFVQLSRQNPFFPLIRNVEPNEDNLVNVEESNLVGIGRNKVYMLNQEGRMVTLLQNDEVYLGRLRSLDMNAGEAVFQLNKGGIIESITLKVER
ncbi:MAG: type 4a pilus biogenesis protein PilO [Balneolaceae bacterium]